VKRFVLYIVLLCCNISLCQIQLPVYDSITNYLFAKSENEKLSIITTNGIFELNNNSWDYFEFTSSSFKQEIKEIGVEFSHKEYLSISTSNDFYLVSVGGGPVFKKDGNQFIRIDNTSLHRNQVWGSFFVYNDKIHIYGGYGFWSFKDYITFYDPNIKQWDIVYNNSAYIPKGRGKSISLISPDDKLYVLGGSTISSQSAMYSTDNDDAFYFDLIKKEFVDLGKISQPLTSKHTLFTLPSIDMSSFLVENDSIIKFDFNNMSYTSFKNNNKKLNIDNKFPTFIVDESIFFISGNNGSKTLDHINLNLLDQSAYSKSTFPIVSEKRDTKIENILIALIGVIFFWIILKLFLYKDHIKAQLLFDEKAIYFKNNSVEITMKEKKFITLLSKNNFISAPQINKIISSKNYSKSHLTSIRNDFIGDINSKLFDLTGNKTSVIETKHPEDNRIKAYKTDINSFKPKISFIKFVFKL
jgi:hypothetical protein